MSKKNGTAKANPVEPIEEKRLPEPSPEEIEETTEISIENEEPTKTPWWKNWKLLAGVGAGIAAIGSIVLLSRGGHKSDEEYVEDLEEYCENDLEDEDEEDSETTEET